MSSTTMSNTYRKSFLVKGIGYTQTRDIVHNVMNAVVEVKAITMIPGMCETSDWTVIVEVYNLHETAVAMEFITSVREHGSEGTKCYMRCCDGQQRNWQIEEFDFHFDNSFGLSKLRTVYPREIDQEFDAYESCEGLGHYQLPEYFEKYVGQNEFAKLMERINLSKDDSCEPEYFEENVGQFEFSQLWKQFDRRCLELNIRV